MKWKNAREKKESARGWSRQMKTKSGNIFIDYIWSELNERLVDDVVLAIQNNFGGSRSVRICTVYVVLLLETKWLWLCAKHGHWPFCLTIVRDQSDCLSDDKISEKRNFTFSLRWVCRYSTLNSFTNKASRIDKLFRMPPSISYCLLFLAQLSTWNGSHKW